MPHASPSPSEYPVEPPERYADALAHATFLGMQLNDILTRGTHSGATDVDAEGSHLAAAIRTAWAERVALLRATSTPSIERTFQRDASPNIRARIRTMGAYDADRIAYYDHCFMRALGHMLELLQLRADSVTLARGGRMFHLLRTPLPDDEGILPNGRIRAIRVSQQDRVEPLVHVEDDTWVRVPEDAEILRELDTIFALFD